MVRIEDDYNILAYDNILTAYDFEKTKISRFLFSRFGELDFFRGKGQKIAKISAC